jgi:hypothetical protein
MRHRKAEASFVTLMIAIMAVGAANAQDIQYSEFLSDYSQLQKSSGVQMDYTYVAPGAEQRMSNYIAVMIDQPEIFVAPDSKYKGIKPDDMKALADSFRAGLAQALTESYLVVDQPGPNVLHLRMALSNVYLKKKRKRLLSYTPIGLVAGVAKSIVISDITKKIDLKGFTVEMEVLDSTTEERFAALLEIRSGTKAEPASWKDVEELIALYSQRVRCRLDNARVAESKRVDCLSDL